MVQGRKKGRTIVGFDLNWSTGEKVTAATSAKVDNIGLLAGGQGRVFICVVFVVGQAFSNTFYADRKWVATATLFCCSKE